MFRLNHIKQNVLILSFATLLAGCGGGGTTTTTDSTSTDLTTTSILKAVSVESTEPIITENSATIKWAPYGYTTKLVEYGTSKKYGSEVLVQEEGTVTLYNLKANTEYHYRIVSEDEKGRPVVSRDKTFTTLESSTQPIVTEPIVTDPIVTEPAPTELIVTDPIVTEPTPTEPVVTDPIVTEPTPTEPTPTEPIIIEPIVEETQTVCIEGDAKIEGHITDKDTKAGLVGVQVNVGGCVTTTDAQGDYTLMNIAINDKAVVTFSSEGYYKNSTVIQITDLSPNYSVVEMDKYISHWAYDSQTHAVSGAHIMIPAGVYINNGSPYIGQVTAGLSYRTSTEKGTDIAFPGEYKGKDSNGIMTPFVSYGFTVIDLTDENGAALNISEDITLIFEATGATENIIPLWYYDYLQGVWIEEGYATRLADGTYEGTVSHPGTWSLSQPIVDSSGIYTDRILYPDGTPVTNLRVHAIGENWISTDLSTDENGVFEIEVIPGKEFTLQAYHYDDKYGATYNGVISAVSAGDIINNSSL